MSSILQNVECAVLLPRKALYTLYMLKIEKVDWDPKEVAELSSFRVWRQPGRGLIGEGKANVAFFYKNSTRKQAVYGSEDEVFEACRKIIAK